MSLPVAVSTEALVERLRRETLAEDQLSARADACEPTYRRAWNSALWHVEHVILPELARRERVVRGLRELRDSQPILVDAGEPDPIAFELDAVAVTRAPAFDLSEEDAAANRLGDELDRARKERR